MRKGKLIYPDSRDVGTTSEVPKFRFAAKATCLPLPVPLPTIYLNHSTTTPTVQTSSQTTFKTLLGDVWDGRKRNGARGPWEQGEYSI